MTKNKIRRKIFVTAFLMASSMLLESAIAQQIFEEKESIIVVEIESAPIKTQWLQGNSTVDGQVVTYYTSKITEYQNPNIGTLTYRVKINNPGTYRFQWHCKVGEGTSPTDANDSWLKIPDADDFYAQKLPSGLSGPDRQPVGNVAHPKGVCTNDCPEGAGKQGWFKVYSNGTVQWTWRSSTNDNDPHAIFARFDNVGTYTVLIAVRSKNQFLNRFVLYNPTIYTESQATNLSLPEASQVNTSVSNSLLDIIEVYPNPASNQLVLSAKNNEFVRYEIVDLGGRALLKGEMVNRVEKIDISSLMSGMFILKCYDINNISTATKFSKYM